MLGLFFLLLTFAAAERPAYAQCDVKSDAEIISNIYAQLKSSKGLASQVNHINAVMVPKLATVKLMGWADSTSDWERVRDIVLSNCVKANVNEFADKPPAEGESLRMMGGSCQTGYKPCGDLCIPEGEVCNIGFFTKQ